MNSLQAIAGFGPLLYELQRRQVNIGDWRKVIHKT